MAKQAQVQGCSFQWASQSQHSSVSNEQATYRIHPAAPNSMTIRHTTAEVGHDGPVRIAIADDMADLRTTLAMLLRHLGHTVVCSAENGADLLEHLTDVAVDVALVDLDMPVMDGLATAQELSARGISVILVSGHPDAQHVVVEHEPIAACISKPASPEALQGAIEQALARRYRPNKPR
jgi:CheY-like chemotaxis protein